MADGDPPRVVTNAADRRAIATLRAYLRTGSMKAAAEDVGITESTARQRLSAYYERHGFKNAAQAAFDLGRQERV